MASNNSAVNPQADEKPKYITQTELIRDRAWSKSLIEKHLNGPDVEKHVGWGRYAYLFNLQRVLEAEANPFVAARIAKIRTNRQPRRDDKPRSGLRMALPIPVPAPVIDIPTLRPLALAAHA